MLTHSGTDTQKGRIDERVSDSRAAGPADNVSKAIPDQKRNATAMEDEGDAVPAPGEVAQPAVSNTEEAAHKKARTGLQDNLTPQQSAAGASRREPDNAASAAPQPISGGFGGLASKADSGFAFGGGAVFGGGAAFGGGGTAGSVSFGGPAFANANASSAAMGGAAPSFMSKASQHAANNGAGTFSEASNAGPAECGAAQHAIRAAMSDAATPAEADDRVFGSQQQQGGDSDARRPNESPPPNGEEEDRTVWSAQAVLYHYEGSQATPSWRSRGVGQVRVNVQAGGRSRLVMRSKQVMRLMLNAGLFPEMHIRHQEGDKQTSFTCLNAADTVAASRTDGEASRAEGGGAQDAPSVDLYALRFKEVDTAVQFHQLLDTYKHPQPQSQAVTDAACDAVDTVAQAMV